MGNKLNILIDGNHHFHKSLYASGNFSKGRMLGTQKDKEMYMRKVAMDLAYALRMFGAPDRVVFTLDQYSWRKDIDTSEQNDGYKANRIKDDSAVDWDAFKELNNDFFEILANKGFITSTLNRCEGDDLLFFWSNKFFEAGEDVVIFSGDGDITQLVKFNDKNFICIFNTRSTTRQVIGAPGFGDWINKKLSEPTDIYDIFMSSDFVPSSVNMIQSIISTTKLVEIDPDEVLFEKIVCGDAGDNIPPIINWQTTQKNGKIINNKITPIKVKTIKEMILDKGNGCDVTKLWKYADVFVKGIKKIYDKDIDIETIKKRLERNTTLVYLSNDTIPINLQNLFEKHYINYINYGAPKMTKMDMFSLLEGTKYNKTITIEADVFSMAAPDNIEMDNSAKSLF